MKVLYVTNSVGMGGASVALINILKDLVENYDVTPLVTCPDAGSFSDCLREMNVKNSWREIYKMRNLLFSGLTP